MIEIFLPVKEFKGYLVSTHGRVFSLKTNKYLKPHYGSCGYLNVFLYNGKNKKFTRKIHRLVGLTFIENKFNKPQINHIDCNKHNNMVENLEWVTNGENLKHAFKNGLKTLPRGEKNPTSKLSDLQVKEIRILLNSRKYKQREIAKMFHIHECVISDIKLGIRKVYNE